MKLARRIKNGVTVVCNSSIRSGICTTGQTVGIMSLDVVKLLHCTASDSLVVEAKRQGHQLVSMDQQPKEHTNDAKYSTTPNVRIPLWPTYSYTVYMLYDVATSLLCLVSGEQKSGGHT
jgi:hypothetical protein